MLKLITIINWIVIGILAILIGAETLFPTKGGDAAGRGMGQAIYYLAIIALVALLILNLLPFKATKYAAFGIILLPFALYAANSVWTSLSNLSALTPAGYNQDGTPWFQDAQKQKIALAIYDGKIEKVKKLVQALPVSKLTESTGEEGNLLEFAVSQASHTSYREQEKTECVRLLLDAGAQFKTTDTTEKPIHASPAAVGNAALLRLLLQHGADPNAREVRYKRPLLFESITAYKQPNESVDALLEAGADPNTLFTDVDSTETSALLHAAANHRWRICMALLEKGADVRYQRTDGKTLADFLDEVNQYFSSDGYSTRADYEQVKAVLQKNTSK
ncbi:MAG: hypothetical protein IPM36_20625 [Lewinellaceae bacterium]|nr:hypothetical protein [Lewinellaceae bacterium]